MQPDAKALFDEATLTVPYVVQDPESDRCAIIDPVLSFDPKSRRTNSQSADEIIAYVAGDAAFVGDTLFLPDYGTARADFPGGDARVMYRSIQKILAVPDETTLYMCHDHKAPGQIAYNWETTVAEEKAGNAHTGAGKTEDYFVAMREARDTTLDLPSLIPPLEDNGVAYLRIPINAL